MIKGFSHRQITNFDPYNTIEIKKVQVGGKPEKEDLEYKVFNLDNNGAFQILKFGYCANNNEGMNYPIFLRFSTDNSNEDHEFKIGKTGMFEYQPEELFFANINDSDSGFYDTTNILLKTVKIYKDVSFVVDYCYTVNDIHIV